MSVLNKIRKYALSYANGLLFANSFVVTRGCMYNWCVRACVFVVYIRHVDRLYDTRFVNERCQQIAPVFSSHMFVIV